MVGICAIVPSYNHWTRLPAVVASLVALRLPVIIVDDGSDAPAAQAIARLHDPAAGIRVHVLEANSGKGAAVMTGFRLAADAGYSHAVQIDADGQHDAAALPAMLALSRRYPDALISGRPIYDSSIPTGRKVGRWITHVWVWIETLSLRIQDSMCGFRIYPLGATLALMARSRIGTGMDFDTEIMVRLFWAGTAVAMLPVRVTYPPDNTSNFKMLRDNWRISCMHTRLVFAMLARLPWVVLRRPPLLDPTVEPGRG